jgi:hypothetical protein
VAAGDLDVGDVAGRRPDRGRRVGLLDVHVEGVDRDAQRRRVYEPDDLERLLDGVDEARLVAVERLDAQHHAAFAGVVRERREMFRETREDGGAARRDRAATCARPVRRADRTR